MDNPKTSFGWVSRLGAIGGAALFMTVIVWAYFTVINGAVIATGTVVVTGKPKTIQHLDGGIINSIKIDEGDHVAPGTVLITLDDTLLVANIKIYRGRLADVLARRARLEAEQANASDFDFEQGNTLLVGFDQSKYQAGQRLVFAARGQLERGKEEQLREKITQFGNQINGVEGLLRAKDRQMDLIRQELAATQDLHAKGLTVASQLLSIQRSEADIEGQVAEHNSELARIKNSIQDIRIEILQNQRLFKEHVVEELREVNTQVGELTQQILSTQKQLDRIEVRAPVGGIIHELQVVTLGGVVPPGGTILQIVPQNNNQSFEVRINPVSIDQVFVGQEAKIRFAAFNARTTPEVFGAVSGVSPTSIVDQATGQSYFKIQLKIEATELAKLGGQELIPGMPIEAYLQTTPRSVLSYFTKPATDQLAKAFREE